MKKLYVLGLISIITGTLTSPVMATEVSSKNTTGSITVKAPDPGTDGNLTLDSVPEDLNFGEQEIGAKATLQTDNPTVQTSDFRATGVGWRLMVKYTTAPEDAWIGAKTGSKGKGFDLNLSALQYGEETASTNAGTPPSSKGFLVNADDHPIATASASTDESRVGLGTWIGTFDKATTTLDIPITNIADSYQAELLWTLQDTPV